MSIHSAMSLINEDLEQIARNSGLIEKLKFSPAFSRVIQ